MLVAVAVSSVTFVACNNEENKKAETPAEPVKEEATVAPAAKDVVDIAIGSADHTTLVAAVKAADLVATLKGPGPFTIFAPTNAAFNALPAGTVDDLLKPEKKAALANILTYHVVAGKVMAKDVAGVKSAKTVQGGELRVDANHGVKINNAKVTQADIEASSGVIHVIDTVLLPA